jgi:tagatose 1,6-diphosphate aldolase
MADAFAFLDPPSMADEDLSLILIARQPAAESLWNVPAYVFHVRHLPSGQKIGRITFRESDTDWIVNYTGHVGYAIDASFRGRRYAERSCRLLLPFVALHRREISLTCAPENAASRRTIERLGGEFIEIIDVPPDYPIAETVTRQKCRYRLRLNGAGATVSL